MSINSISFNNLLVTRGNMSGRNMNPVHLHYRSKKWEGGDHDFRPCHAPCGVLHAVGVADVSQVQLCVGFHVGWRKTPCL